MQAHRITVAGLRGNRLRVYQLMAVQILVRLFAVLPPVLTFLLPQYKTMLPWTLAFSALICVLVQFPMRFRAAIILENIVSPSAALHPASYGRRLVAGLLRLFFGILWGIPFGACAILFYQYFFVYEASRAGKALEKIGSTVFPTLPLASQHTVGVILSVCIALFSILLLLYGWRRGTAFDFLMHEDVAPGETWRSARRVHRLSGKQLRANALVSFLLLLPPILASAFVFCLRSGGLSQGMMTAYLALSTGLILEPEALILAAAVFFILYLPFVPYRKARNAAVVVNCHE